MRTRFRTVAAVAVLAVAGLAVAQPASAATDPIGLSYNGVTFTPTLATALFSDVSVVPGSTVTRSFWVKNQESSTGNLALAVSGVSSADDDLLEHLTIAADLGDGAGTAIGFSDVGTCATLLSGIPLPAGATTRIYVSLDLAPAVGGVQAQGAIGAFDLMVRLTSDVVQAPDGCGALPPAPPVTTPGGPGGGSSTTAPPGTAHFPGIGGTSPVLPGTPGEETETAPTPDVPEATDPTGMIGNTARFFQEYTALLWLIGLLLGGVIAWGRARRRERIPE
jgi:hypothetical protein